MQKADSTKQWEYKGKNRKKKKKKGKNPTLPSKRTEFSRGMRHINKSYHKSMDNSPTEVNSTITTDRIYYVLILFHALNVN